MKLKDAIVASILSIATDITNPGDRSSQVSGSRVNDGGSPTERYQLQTYDVWSKQS